jgi:hypothetical protein
MQQQRRPPPHPLANEGGGRDDNEGRPPIMAVEDKYVYTPNDPKKMANVRCLAQLMEKKGATYKEVQLTNEGQQWGPTHVNFIRSLNDIVSLPIGNQGKAVVLDLHGC